MRMYVIHYHRVHRPNSLTTHTMTKFYSHCTKSFTRPIWKHKKNLNRKDEPQDNRKARNYKKEREREEERERERKKEREREREKEGGREKKERVLGTLIRKEKGEENTDGKKGQEKEGEEEVEEEYEKEIRAKPLNKDTREREK
jgi:hypothetical protein